MTNHPLSYYCLGTGEYGVPAAAEEYRPGKYRYLRITDISDDGELLYNDIKGVTHPDAEQCLLGENQIVFARTGNSTGRTFFYEPKYGPLVYAGFLIRYRIDPARINPRYLKYYTLSKQYRDWVKNFSGGGSTRGKLSATDLNSMPVYAPSRDQQDTLVRVLDALTDKITLNQRINAELEAMAKLLYDYWFVQFDFPFDFAQGKPDAKGRPYKSSGGRMVYNAELKREVPEGWEVTELRKYLKSNRGLSYTSADIGAVGRPMINLNSFNPSGTYKVEGLKLYSGPVISSKVLQPFDLVMCNTQQTALDPAKDIIGKSLLVPDIFDKEVLSSHHVTTISVNKPNLKYFLNCLFNTEYFHRYISGYCSGTNILGLNFEGVLSYRTAIPNDGLLERFGTFIHSIEQRKSVTLKENQELTALRDWLLPLLMNGQVRVGEAEEKVPPSRSATGENGLALAAEPAGRYGKKR